MWTRLITSMSSTDRPSRQWPAYSMHWRHSETTRSGVASAAVSGCLKRLLLLSGKRTCRQLECHWKRTGAESDYVVYRTACPIANILIEIKASRSAFHTQQLTEAARNQKAIWRQAKELLHSDDRPPPPIRPRDVSKLCECDGISRFFYDKLKTSA